MSSIINNWKNRLVNLLYTLFWIMIAFLISYYVYGQDWTAAVGFVLWAIVIYIASWLVIIPYAGVVFIWIIGTRWSPELMETFSIYRTWLTDFTFVILMIIPTFVYVVFTLLITFLITRGRPKFIAVITVEED